MSVTIRVVLLVAIAVALVAERILHRRERRRLNYAKCANGRCHHLRCTDVGPGCIDRQGLCDRR